VALRRFPGTYVSMAAASLLALVPLVGREEMVVQGSRLLRGTYVSIDALG
jgi:hypothetical protein